ncbi:ABC transporter substrate-binding protein [Shinella daejeonensis]|uniref:glycine betaine ABC transporter substrate-binding protein n=1 Tax=Shinella daejeonensis TaxID=659017 RepID=UPI0020C82F7A|nr:glycine betaine ABC transporter substrate-binding protein [Shinella daejeonensis]MCP8897114.1 ABC transporter substrate-binding protein [Shinella daejeonensis]
MYKLLSALGLLGFLGCGSVVQAAECGSLTIADMNWQSAEVLAGLDSFVLTHGFGCSVEMVAGDTVPTIMTMAEKGQPDIMSEAWVEKLPQVVERGVAEGTLVIAAKALPDGGQNGWWIPKYLADAHPDIKTIADALKHPELFPEPEGSGKGAVYNGPQGWGGTVVTAQLFKAFEAEKAGFMLIDPGSAAGLDGSISKANERKEGWIGFYWSPTALLGKYDMVRLDNGVSRDDEEWKRCTTVETCPDPKPNGWRLENVYTLVSKRFADAASPEVMDYLNKRSWSNDTVNKLMLWMTDNQADGEDGARHFLKENPDIWKTWVSPEAAARIEAAL